MKITNETDNYIVINKAAGEDSEHDIPHILSELSGKQVSDFYCVHRLDKAAAGLIVYGKTKAAAAELTSLIQKDELKKSYLAVVAGTPDPESGTYTDLLYKDKSKQKMFPVKRMRKGVKEASLDYKVLETIEADGNIISLVSIELHTGRFHQIRCQFASRRMPLLGDGKYGSRIRAKNLCLFCNKLWFFDIWQKKAVEFIAQPDSEIPWNMFNSIR